MKVSIHRRVTCTYLFLVNYRIFSLDHMFRPHKEPVYISVFVSTQVCLFCLRIKTTLEYHYKIFSGLSFIIDAPFSITECCWKPNKEVPEVFKGRDLQKHIPHTECIKVC